MPHLSQGIERHHVLVVPAASDVLEEVAVHLQISQTQHHPERGRQAEEALERDGGHEGCHEQPDHDGSAGFELPDFVGCFRRAFRHAEVHERCRHEEVHQ
ncbi:hypothetical protein D3C87_1632160 [compost metagenome]